MVTRTPVASSCAQQRILGLETRHPGSTATVSTLDTAVLWEAPFSSSKKREWLEGSSDAIAGEIVIVGVQEVLVEYDF